MLRCNQYLFLQHVKCSKTAPSMYHGTKQCVLLYSTVDDVVKRVTFRDKFKEIWNGPNFKYWFIGATAFVSWMSYYGLETYKKSRIEVELPPPLPNHPLVERIDDVELLHTKLESQVSLFGSEKIKKIMVLGAPASGKSVLVHSLVKSLLQKQDGFKLSLPKSHVSAFLLADCEANFLASLKALAAKLNIRPSDLDEETSEVFKSAPFTVQCDILLACIQKSLMKHPGWIFIVDNLQSNTPSSIGDVVNKWFKGDAWSNGTLILTGCNINSHSYHVVNEDQKFYMNKGLSSLQSYQLLKDIAGLELSQSISASFERLIHTAKYSPLAITSVGILLRERLSLKKINTIDEVIVELCKEIDEKLSQVRKDNLDLSKFMNPSTFETLLATQTLVAMCLNHLLNKNEHISHGVDLIASLKPGTILPQSLLNRHFTNKFYNLPALSSASYGLSDVFKRQQSVLDKQDKKLDESLDKEKAWSNKNLAEYIRKVKDFFISGIDTVKMIYNLIYGVLPDLPEKDDGLDMFRSCEILSTQLMEPGGVKGITLHPLVYNAARQHFLASTVYKMEKKHLEISEKKYNHQSWYKKINGFNSETCLFQYRASAGEFTPSENNSSEMFLERYNFGINISSVYNEEFKNTDVGGQWKICNDEMAKYLQGHLSRVLFAINDEILVCKQSLAGRTAKNYLLSHLDFILQNQTLETVGKRAYVESLSTIANCVANLTDDFQTSKTILERVLSIQKNFPENHSLEIAKTMVALAKVYQSLDDFEQSRKLLEQAAELHEADRRKVGEYKQVFEFGKLLGLLGVTYGALNMKLESKETIERSLMLLQAAPPDLADEAKSKAFGADFACALTDLGHSYVLMGMPLYGKKILDLSLAALRNIHGTDNHPEVVRAITVLGVAHLMQGHNEESRRLRREAGKIQAAINALPMY